MEDSGRKKVMFVKVYEIANKIHELLSSLDSKIAVSDEDFHKISNLYARLNLMINETFPSEGDLNKIMRRISYLLQSSWTPQSQTMLSPQEVSQMFESTTTIFAGKIPKIKHMIFKIKNICNEIIIGDPSSWGTNSRRWKNHVQPAFDLLDDIMAEIQNYAKYDPESRLFASTARLSDTKVLPAIGKRQAS